MVTVDGIASPVVKISKDYYTAHQNHQTILHYYDRYTKEYLKKSGLLRDKSYFITKVFRSIRNLLHDILLFFLNIVCSIFRRDKYVRYEHDYEAPAVRDLQGKESFWKDFSKFLKDDVMKRDNIGMTEKNVLKIITKKIDEESVELSKKLLPSRFLGRENIYISEHTIVIGGKKALIWRYKT